MDRRTQTSRPVDLIWICEKEASEQKEKGGLISRRTQAIQMLLKTLDSNRKISNSMTEDFEVLRTEADIYIARA